MYTQLSRYYDLIHQELTADIPFILRLAAEANSPLLELGCGSGRLLIPLARAGHTITGLDNSSAMLAIAQQRLKSESSAVQSRVRLLEGDMVTLSLPEEEAQYGLIFAAYNTFMHLTPAQMTAALRRIRHLLKPNGRLYLDLSNPFTLAESDTTPTLALENVLHDPATAEVVLQLSAERVDTAEQILHVTWVFDASPVAGGPVQRSVVEMAYHYRFPHELEQLLSQAGLRLRTLYGDYDATPFDEESERLLLIGSLAA